ncbi:unnamed protein product [marine sediment metagenome]|uniref:Uncharacterized protein n=1 Tax=marine sediment metagenome TaxID=412755 RepID=X0U4F9_9ZZZZ
MESMNGEKETEKNSVSTLGEAGGEKETEESNSSADVRLR